MGRHSSSGKPEAGGEQYRKEEKHHKHMEKLGKPDAGGEQYRKEEKHHKHMEKLAKLGAVAAGAYVIRHEKHEARKDPEHARSHEIKEKIAITVAAGSAGFAIHEHHKKKEAKQHARHVHRR